MKHSQFLVLFLSFLLFSNAFTINDQDIANQSDKTRFRAPQIDEFQVEQEFKPQQNLNSNPSTQQYEPESQPDIYATNDNPQQNVYYNDQNIYYDQPQQNYQAQYDPEPLQQQTYETVVQDTQYDYPEVSQTQPEYTQHAYEQVHQQEYVPEPVTEINQNVDSTYQEVYQVKPEYTEQIYEQVNYVQEEVYQAKPEYVEQVYYTQEQQAYEEVNYQESTQAYQYEEVPVYQNQYEQVDNHIEKPVEQQNVHGYVEVAHQQTQEFVENNQAYNYQETQYVEEPARQEETYQYHYHEEHNNLHSQEQSTEEVPQYSHKEHQQYDQQYSQEHDGQYEQQDTQQYTETYYQETQQPAEPVHDDTQYEQYQAKDEYVQYTADNTPEYSKPEPQQQVEQPQYQQTQEYVEQQSQHQEEYKDEYAQHDEYDYEQEYAQQQQEVQPVEQYQEYEQYQAKPEPVEQTSEQYQQQYQSEPAQQQQQYDQYEQYEDDKYDEDVDEYYLEPKPEIQQNSDYANNQHQYHQETVQQTYQQENQYVESTPDVVDQYYEHYSQQANEVLDKYIQETVEPIQKEIVEVEVDSHQTHQADEKPYVPEPKPVETQPVYETPAQPTVEHVQPVQQIQQEKPVQAKQQHLTKAITQTNYISSDEDSYDATEKFFVSVVGPAYKQVKENYYLDLAIKGGFGLIWVAILISVVNKLVFSKPTDQTLLGELKSLKSQLNTLGAPSSSFISELKNELRVLNQNVARNEATTAALISDKKNIDNFVVEFQHEVMESHKAIWKELNHIGKTFSAPSLKIPAKTKKVTNTGGAPLSSLLGDETNANTPATSSSMMFGQQNSASSVINEKVKTNTVAQVLSPNSPPEADSAASSFTPQQVKSIGKPVVNISSFGTRGGMPLSQMLSMNGENTPISGIEASIVTNPVNPFKVNKIKPIGAPKSVF